MLNILEYRQNRRQKWTIHSLHLVIQNLLFDNVSFSSDQLNQFASVKGLRVTIFLHPSFHESFNACPILGMSIKESLQCFDLKFSEKGFKGDNFSRVLMNLKQNLLQLLWYQLLQCVLSTLIITNQEMFFIIQLLTFNTAIINFFTSGTLYIGKICAIFDFEMGVNSGAQTGSPSGPGTIFNLPTLKTLSPLLL